MTCENIKQIFSLARTAKLEPYLGFLHSIQYGKPSLVCDLQELYRHLMDDFVVGFCQGLSPKDFVSKDETVSRSRKGKREYLKDSKTRRMMKELDEFLLTRVEIPLIRHGKKQARARARTARMNYLLSIIDILKQTRLSRGINIPVYLCDSVRIPTERPDISATRNTIGQSYVIPTAVGEFRVPVFKDTNMEIRVLRTLKEYSNRPVEDYLKVIRDQIGHDQELLFRPILRALHNKITELEKKDLDGIWASFIENFFAPILTGPFQFVVGNPPWVAPIHVPKEYRDGVKNLISNSGFLKPYQPKFKIATAVFPGAGRQYSACLPFVHLALNRYLKPGGKCGFLLTSSLLRLLHSGGWREKMFDFQLDKIIDMSLITDIHEGAICWSFIPIVINNKDSLDSKVQFKYIWQEKHKKRKKLLPEEIPILYERSWKTSKKQLSLDRKNLTSPWFVAEPSALKIFHRMQKYYPRIGDTNPINMGIKTSANRYYALKNVKNTGDYIVGENLAGEKVIIEKDLIYPACKGKHVRSWTYDHTHLIVPHQPPTWKPIPENVMKKKYPEAYDYFSERKQSLLNRTDYSKGPFYMIFRISKKKMAAWRVAYAYTATQLEACVIPKKILDPLLNVEKELIVEETAYSITARNQSEAFFIGGLLNSLPLKAFVQSFAKPKGFPYFGYYKWNVGILPIPKYDESNKLHVEISEVSKYSHKEQSSHIDLDELVSTLYKITTEEFQVLNNTLDMLTGKLKAPLSHTRNIELT